MEVRRSAHRHGISNEDVRHAIEHALVVADMDPQADPPRVLVIGPNKVGNPIEIVMLELADDRRLVIHAMKLRPTFYGLLEEEDDG